VAEPLSFLRGLSLSTLCTGAAFALGFANQSLLARELGPQAFGTLRIWFTTVMLVGLIAGEWLNRGSAYAVGVERQRGVVLANMWLYGLLLTGLLLPLCWLGSRLELPLDLAGSGWVILAGLIGLTVMQRGGLGIILGEDRISLHASIPLAFIATYLAGNGLSHLRGGLALAQVLDNWLLAVALAAVVAAVPMLRGAKLRFDGAAFRRMFEVGGRGSASVVIIFLLFRSDIYLIDHFLGETQVGVYAVALIFAELVQRLPNIAGVVLLPKVIRGEDGDDALSLRVAQGTLIFGLAASTLLAAVAEPVIELAFEGYGVAYVPLLWMLPGLVFSGFGSVLNVKLAGQGYPAVTVWAPAAALAVNVGANLALIPVLGLRGAALATSVAYALWALIVTGAFLRRSGLGWRAFLDLSRIWRG